MNDINERLLKAKAALRYSYSDLEKLTGIPKSTLQRCFIGDTEKIPLDCILPICHALQLDAAELLGWKQINVVSDPLPMDTIVLSDEEKLLILSYRDASAERRKIVRNILMEM